MVRMPNCCSMCYMPGVTRKEFKNFWKPKFYYLESQEKALLKLKKKLKITKLSFTKAMENIYAIKESLVYSTLNVQTVLQNIYQHKSSCNF